MKKVLLIDSGSGGVNILKECVKVCPYCDYLLFCDDKNLPYGDKPIEILQQIVLKNLKDIQKFFKFEIVILACNTLSCTCLEKVRKEFPDTIFIGVVPAVKPALEKWKQNEILVLATENTLKNNILIRQNDKLLCKSMPKLAGLIDKNLDNLDAVIPYLQDELSSFLNQKPKAIVLGCTHYLSVKKQIYEIIGDGVEFFDGTNGVARRLKYFVLNEDCCDKKQNEYDRNENEKTLHCEKINQTANYQVQIIVSQNQNLLPILWWWFQND